MKEISRIREFSGDEACESITKQIRDNAPEDKEKILGYLKSFPADCAAGMSLVDEITGETQNIGVEGYEDGEFYWDTREIYHFEKYNIKLNADFMQHVLSK